MLQLQVQLARSSGQVRLRMHFCDATVSRGREILLVVSSDIALHGELINGSSDADAG